jgi:hypothetical protein
MESGIIVYKKVVPGANVDETIQRCLVLYGDKLHADLNSGDSESRVSTQRALEIEEMLARHSDAFLPDRFKKKDYNRLRAVYAFPFDFPEEWCYPNLVPASKSFADGETVMRMRVDGSSALVLPMSVVNRFYSKNFDGQFYALDEQKDTGAIEDYWTSAVSLEEFVRDFENPYPRDYVWYSKDGERQIETPEVLIPEWDLGKVLFMDTSEKRVQTSAP